MADFGLWIADFVRQFAIRSPQSEMVLPFDIAVLRIESKVLAKTSILPGEALR